MELKPASGSLVLYPLFKFPSIPPYRNVALRAASQYRQTSMKWASINLCTLLIGGAKTRGSISDGVVLLQLSSSQGGVHVPIFHSLK